MVVVVLNTQTNKHWECCICLATVKQSFRVQTSIKLDSSTEDEEGGAGGEGDGEGKFHLWPARSFSSPLFFSPFAEFGHSFSRVCSLKTGMYELVSGRGKLCFAMTSAHSSLCVGGGGEGGTSAYRHWMWSQSNDPTVACSAKWISCLKKKILTRTPQQFPEPLDSIALGKLCSKCSHTIYRLIIPTCIFIPF